MFPFSFRYKLTQRLFQTLLFSQLIYTMALNLAFSVAQEDWVPPSQPKGRWERSVLGQQFRKRWKFSLGILIFHKICRHPQSAIVVGCGRRAAYLCLVGDPKPVLKSKQTQNQEENNSTISEESATEDITASAYILSVNLFSSEASEKLLFIMGT